MEIIIKTFSINKFMTTSILPIQIIFVILLLFPISRVWLRFRDGNIHFGSFFFWITVWLAGLVVIFFPDSTTYWANLIGIGRGSDLIIYGAISILFYLIFRTNVMLENTRNEITKLVREIALLEKEPKKKK